MTLITRTKATVGVARTISANCIRYKAGETIERGQPVYIASTGLGMLASSAAAASAQARGLAIHDNVSGQWDDLLERGEIEGFSGMTPGGAVYVNLSGELGDAAGDNSKYVGYALSATLMRVTL